VSGDEPSLLLSPLTLLQQDDRRRWAFAAAATALIE